MTKSVTVSQIRKYHQLMQAWQQFASTRSLTQDERKILDSMAGIDQVAVLLAEIDRLTAHIDALNSDLAS